MVASAASASERNDQTPLSPLIHGRVRLLILSYLVPRSGGATFGEIKAEIGLTDGTLSVHLSKLEGAGIVEIIKGYVGKRPRTLVKVTASGRRRFQAYVEELRHIVPGLR